MSKLRNCLRKMETNKKQEKQGVKEVFDEVQKLLDSLQDKDATFLFIGDEGNHFVISGNSDSICAQIIFSMCRYPVIAQIIKKCASRFDEMNGKFGATFRNVSMTHLIEQNSGN